LQLVQILQGLSCHLAGFLPFCVGIVSGDGCSGQQNHGENGSDGPKSHWNAPLSNEVRLPAGLSTTYISQKRLESGGTIRHSL